MLTSLQYLWCLAMASKRRSAAWSLDRSVLQVSLARSCPYFKTGGFASISPALRPFGIQSAICSLVRPVAAFADRMLLVRLDELAEHNLDRSRPRNRLCHNGHIQHLLGNRLAETYEEYASSALATQGFCRNLLGGIFPLVIPAMFRSLTFHGAESLLGSLGVLLTLVPWVLVAFGPKIRAKSRFARAKA